MGAIQENPRRNCATIREVPRTNLQKLDLRPKRMYNCNWATKRARNLRKCAWEVVDAQNRRF